MKKAVPVLLLCLAAVSVIGVSAYFISTKTKVNEIQIGSVTTEIVENFPTPDPTPGGDVQKTVTIKNTGPNPCYVRAQALLSDEDMGSVKDFNTTDWVKGPDGWWYYKNILNVGATTPALFTKVTVDSDVPEDEIDFDVFVRQESTQAFDAENNAMYSSYQVAWGI